MILFFLLLFWEGRERGALHLIRGRRQDCRSRSDHSFVVPSRRSDVTQQNGKIFFLLLFLTIQLVLLSLFFSPFCTIYCCVSHSVISGYRRQWMLVDALFSRDCDSNSRISEHGVGASHLLSLVFSESEIGGKWEKYVGLRFFPTLSGTWGESVYTRLTLTVPLLPHTLLPSTTSAFLLLCQTENNNNNNE